MQENENEEQHDYVRIFKRARRLNLPDAIQERLINVLLRNAPSGVQDVKDVTDERDVQSPNVTEAKPQEAPTIESVNLPETEEKIEHTRTPASVKTDVELFPLLESLVNTEDYRSAYEHIRQAVRTNTAYAQLVKFLKEFKHTRRLAEQSVLGSLLAKTHDDEKLTVLSHYLKRERTELFSQENLDLVLVCSDLCSWFPRHPASWRSVSSFLLAEYEQHKTIPTLHSLYSRQQFVFLDAPFELAIWEPVLKHPHVSPWHAIAQLHCFLAQGLHAELLWATWAFFQQSEAGKTRWERLHERARVHLETSKRMDSDEKALFLNLVAPDLQRNALDLLNFIRRFGLPEHESLVEELIEFAGERSLADLELELLQQLQKRKFLAANELERFVDLARKLSKDGLAQRAENILRLRSLASQPKLATQLGSVLHFRVPTTNLVSLCLWNFNLQERKFLSSYFYLGPSLYYLACKDAVGFRALKRKEYTRDPALKELHAGFSKYPKLMQSKEFLVHENRYSQTFAAEIPTFCQDLPDNEWSKQLAFLSQILGFNHFAQLHGILLKLGAQIDEKQAFSSLLRKWLDASDKEVKTAWYQLHAVLPVLPLAAQLNLLERFLCRMSSLLCQNYQLGLASLQGCSEVLRSDFEYWLLNCTDLNFSGEGVS